MRILLVEDNKALCEATALALRNEGWSVDTVHRGDEARFYLAEGGYDAILLDRMLPGCDGIQLVREMRQQKDDTPVLLVTALDDVRACLLYTSLFLAPQYIFFAEPISDLISPAVSLFVFRRNIGLILRRREEMVRSGP